ncbi:MAG: hypothetical protein DWQ02_12285 [Bacteroidetes bacterium]|nr:MAG: hypothetical protein DWQ02_12285 [Bacteroidota bacterium]
MSEQLTGKLNPIQLELLKLFSTNISDSDLSILKKILLDFRMKRAVDAANEAWEEKNWTEKDVQRILDTHMRTPYKSQEEHLKNK